MSNISRMSGTSWHITQIKTEEEKQMRRGKCKFFDKRKTICRCKKSPKYLLTCLTAGRCDFYEEGKYIKEPNCNPFKNNNSELNKKTNKELKYSIDNDKIKKSSNCLKEKDNKESKPIVVKRIPINDKIRIGDIVDIEAVNACRIKKTFKMLDKNSAGKYNEITEVCLGKKLNQFILYKNKRYVIKKIER